MSRLLYLYDGNKNVTTIRIVWEIVLRILLSINLYNICNVLKEGLTQILAVITTILETVASDGTI